MSSGTQLHPVVSSARIVNQTTMATSAQLKTCEQSSGSSQESNTSSNTNINENHHGLNPRATPFTPHVPTKPSPTHQSQGCEHPTTQAAIPSKIEDLLLGKIKNYVSRVRVQDDTELASSATALSEKAHPVRQPTIPPTAEELKKGRKMNFVWDLET